VSPAEKKRKAYASARLYLEMRGFTIIEQNFRRPRSLIDIIAKKDEVVFFVVVDYKPNDELLKADSTNPSSDLIKQLKSGALSWVEETKWGGKYMFSRVEIAGDSFTVMGFIDNLFE
jgi:Holliday junction resolvase-like predicted endonuclease